MRVTDFTFSPPGPDDRYIRDPPTLVPSSNGFYRPTLFVERRNGG